MCSTRTKYLQPPSRGRKQQLPARKVSNILRHQRCPGPHRFQCNKQIAKMMHQADLPKSASRATQQDAGLNPGRRGRRGEVAEGVVRPAEFVETSFFTGIMGACVEFRGYDRCQNGALEDSGILTEPKIILSTVESNVNAGIEEKGTGRERNHCFARARSKTSSMPPRFHNLRRA